MYVYNNKKLHKCLHTGLLVYIQVYTQAFRLCYIHMFTYLSPVHDDVLILLPDIILRILSYISNVNLYKIIVIG